MITNVLTISVSSKVALCSFVTSPSLPSPTPDNHTHICFQALQITFPFSRVMYKWNHQYVLLWGEGWCPLRTIRLRFIPVSFFFFSFLLLFQWFIPFYCCMAFHVQINQNLVIHIPTHGHLCFFQFGDIPNTADISTDVQVLGGTYTFFSSWVNA